MKITVRFRYWNHNVIPPRCRKPRTVEHEGVTEIEIPEVTGDEAPVAFRVPEISRDATEIRWWNNELWQPYRPWSHQQEDSRPGSKYFPAEQRAESYLVPYSADGLDETLPYITEWFGRFLIVDGVVWKQAGEPRYVVMTFGLGHNHSFTSLSTDSHYNGNIHRSRYYRADSFDDAKAEAIRVALERGDTDSVPMIEHEPPIEILIPEAVRCQPEQEAGDGDPFLNQLYGVTSTSQSVGEAGALVIAMGLKTITTQT
jgi:hypothetical protein